MSDISEEVCALQTSIKKQQSTVRQLKKDYAEGASNLDKEAFGKLLDNEVQVLQQLRVKLSELEAPLAASTPAFPKKAFDELILRKMYLVPSFEIHNGPAGLLDYGPPACALKANVLSLWRTHFVVEEGMLEMECTNLTPSPVLEASGHVERFTDFMVRDEVTMECFRADKLLEEAVDALLAANPHMDSTERDEHLRVQRQADAYSAEELHAMLQKYNVKSPSNKENNLTAPFPFNLMFKTTIGPEGTLVGYLRPETAQGLFVNFR